MATVLEKSLKRELAIGDEPYMLTISPDGLKLVPKGKRNGIELQWHDLVSGQAALAVALNASLEKIGTSKPRAPSPPEPVEIEPTKTKSKSSGARRTRQR
jgi:hypothetical protein